MRSVKLFLAVVVSIFFVGTQQSYAKTPEKGQVKSVIFMIGDGMGFPQMQSGMASSQTPLAMTRAQATAFVSTHSANDKVTDSAAAGTALATGTKTNNGAIGVDPQGVRLENIREYAAANGMATGVVVTSRVTHATPAAFIAHNGDRGEEEAIAIDVVESGIDVFMGSGRDKFSSRADGVDLVEKLKAKGYRDVATLEQLETVKKGEKIAGLFAEKPFEGMLEGRGDFLPKATAAAIRHLDEMNDKGFFLMVEGSQIDWAGHGNNAEGVVAEVLDFDAAVKEAFDFADKNDGVLVIVTADHETGGMSLPYTEKGNFLFSTGGHSALMVPLIAYGAGAENFKGFIDNTDVSKIIKKILVTPSTRVPSGTRN